MLGFWESRFDLENLINLHSMHESGFQLACGNYEKKKHSTVFFGMFLYFIAFLITLKYVFIQRLCRNLVHGIFLDETDILLSFVVIELK